MHRRRTLRQIDVGRRVRPSQRKRLQAGEAKSEEATAAGEAKSEETTAVGEAKSEEATAAGEAESEETTAADEAESAFGGLMWVYR